MKILEFDNVWEKYRIKFVEEGNVYWEEFWALEDISFSVEKGEVIGIIGRNGAGKTTLLKLIAGMLIPDKGNVSVEGRVSALMELGAGFNPEFTGIENIKLNAALYGLSEESLREKMSSIIDFADLGDFINAPVKYYSQGMYMRLAFALAIFVEPDILLIDDILAVGDEETQQKCIKKIFELKESGKTIILVSHDMNMVSKLCNWVMLLEEGKIIMRGLPQKVILHYLETVGDRKGVAVLEKDKLRVIFNQEELARLRKMRTISSGNISLYADVEAKAIRLYYRGKEITKSRGLYITMKIEEEGFWIHSSGAQWQVNKISDRELVIAMGYEKLSLQKFWKLLCKDKNTLEISIEAQINKPISFMHYDVRLEVKDIYERWETPYEKGNFTVKQFVDNIAPIRLKDNKISDIVLRPRNEYFPMMLFSSSSHLERRIMGIYKYKKSNEELVCLNSSLIIPRKDRLFGVGKYTFFKGKIVLDNNVKTIAKERREDAIELSNGSRLKFIFYQGKGKIFWEDRELTTGLSVYTSLRSSGIWYDSYQAIWEILKKEKDKILVSGDWAYLPISQLWKIELNSNSIYWEVYMNVYEEVTIEIEQANIMLSSGYRNWEVAGSVKGKFLEEYTQDYDILPFRFWYGKSDEISASGKDLPRVIFKSDAEKLNLRAVIENTDSLYQARLLQYQKTNESKLVRGKYLFFKGAIKIEAG